MNASQDTIHLLMHMMDVVSYFCIEDFGIVALIF